jgi:membrane-bound lytic murein transglycosylase A
VIRRLSAAAALLMLGGLAGCVTPPPPANGPGFTPARFSDLPGWNNAHPAEAMRPLLESCARLAILPPDQLLGGTGEAALRGGQAGQWTQVCAAARAVPPGDDAAARQFFETNLQPWRVTDSGADRVLFTGYYEPEVEGSLRRGGPYQVPVYAKPPDLVRVDASADDAAQPERTAFARLVKGTTVPYWTRAEIDAGALAGRHLELLWLKDPVDLFVLQLQGSGRVRLPNGRLVSLAYAGKNGQPYVPIGRVIAQRDGIDPSTITMPVIRAWLADHPDQIRQVLDANPSYVFFREMPDADPDIGPPGTLGVPLTPGHSVAIDRAVIPLGAPLWIDSTDPVDHTPIQRLVMAQDLGSAINGALHTDVFFGWGPQAEARAGVGRQAGTEWLLLPVGQGASPPGDERPAQTS